MTEELLFSTLKYDNLSFCDTLEYQTAKKLDDLRKDLERQAETARELHIRLVSMLQNKKEINVLMDRDFQELIKEIEKIEKRG